MLARESGREAPDIPDETMRLLARYAWPGNVRELRNAMERAFIMAAGQGIDKALVEAWLSEEPQSAPGSSLCVGMTVKDAEERLIRMTLDHFDGHREKTAEALGISVRTLINRLREWKMEANVA